MTQIAIKEQLAAQRKTTQKATESREAARKYLISIGAEKKKQVKKKKPAKSK